MRARVDLPQPDSPTTASVLPRSSLKLTPLSACTVRALAEDAAADVVVALQVAGFEDELGHQIASSSAEKSWMVGSRPPTAFSGRAERSACV